MNIERLRDSFVFMITSVTRMLGTARWTVFLIDNKINNLKEKYGPIEKLDAALCGYVVDYYDGKNSKQIELVPALLNGKMVIFITLREQTEVVDYDLNNEQGSMIAVHEQIKVMLAEKQNDSSSVYCEKQYAIEFYDYTDLEGCNSFSPDEKPIKVVDSSTYALKADFERLLVNYEGWKYKIVDADENTIISGAMDPGDIEVINSEIWTDLIGKVVDLTIYDCGTGTCEILSADTRGVTVQWIIYTTCYNCQSVEKDFYIEPNTIAYDLIAEFKNARIMSKEEIEANRVIFIQEETEIIDRVMEDNCSYERCLKCSVETCWTGEIARNKGKEKYDEHIKMLDEAEFL